MYAIFSQKTTSAVYERYKLEEDTDAMELSTLDAIISLGERERMVPRK